MDKVAQDNKNTFDTLDEVAAELRKRLEKKKFIVIFGYNGTGKTRLSMVYKDLGKKIVAMPLATQDGDALTTHDGSGILAQVPQSDTLYFNAFTEDLFQWDNDLDADQNRILKINTRSKFFNGLKELEMENRIRPLFQRYVDLNFKIDYNNGNIKFEREVSEAETTKKIENIKISRGEENIFIWCFFLAIAQLAVDKQEAYKWVKYIYVDDPISSLDDNNAISVACHLAEILNDEQSDIKVVVSSHHSLFFNVIYNEIKKDKSPVFLKWNNETQKYTIEYTNENPFFHHVALLKELKELCKSGKLYTYHFNILRSILEKTASFHGYKNFSECLKKDGEDDKIHARMINVLSHGSYSLFEPKEMGDDTKNLFIKILDNFMGNYRFNAELFNTQIITSNPSNSTGSQNGTSS